MRRYLWMALLGLLLGGCAVYAEPPSVGIGVGPPVVVDPAPFGYWHGPRYGHWRGAGYHYWHGRYYRY